MSSTATQLQQQAALLRENQLRETWCAVELDARRQPGGPERRHFKRHLVSSDGQVGRPRPDPGEPRAAWMERRVAALPQRRHFELTCKRCKHALIKLTWFEGLD